MLLGDDADQEALVTGVVSGDLERRIARMREEGWKNLEPEKRTFVLSYIETGSTSQTCIELGIPAKIGRKLMLDPLVRACIIDVQDVLLQDSIIVKSEVRRRMDRLWNIAVAEEDTYIMTSDGIQMRGRVTNLVAARGVNEWFGKELGMTEQNKGKRGDVVVNIDFGRMSRRTQEQIAQGVTIEQLPDPGEIDD